MMIQTRSVRGRELLTYDLQQCLSISCYIIVIISVCPCVALSKEHFPKICSFLFLVDLKKPFLFNLLGVLIWELYWKKEKKIRTISSIMIYIIMHDFCIALFFIRNELKALGCVVNFEARCQWALLRVLVTWLPPEHLYFDHIKRKGLISGYLGSLTRLMWLTHGLAFS